MRSSINILVVRCRDCAPGSLEGSTGGAAILGIGGSPPDGLVFAGWDGSPRSPKRLSEKFSKAMKDAGLPHVTLHTLRHTHASQLITSGMDILTVSRRLGHASPTITLAVYGHLLSPEDRAADIMQAMFVEAGITGQ
jgi:integrase